MPWLVLSILFVLACAGLLFAWSRRRTRSVPIRDVRAASDADVLSSPRWVGPGHGVAVPPVDLRAPLAYFADGRRRPRKAWGPYAGEPSVVDTSLSVAPAPGGAEPLPHKPRYAGLSPAQRLGYLSWLAAGRPPRPADDGFLTLFLCGVERRVLLENQDVPRLFDELLRLRDGREASAGGRKACDQRLRALPAFLAARFPQLLDANRVAALFAGADGWGEDDLAGAVSWFAARAAVIPEPAAFALAGVLPKAHHGAALGRVPGQFRALFAARFRETFGDDLSVEPAKREALFAYAPLNPSIASGVARATGPNPMGLASQFDPLVDLWDGCAAELRKLGTVVAKGGDGKLTLAAWEAMPEELRAGVDHPLADAFAALVAESSRATNPAHARESSRAAGQNRIAAPTRVVDPTHPVNTTHAAEAALNAPPTPDAEAAPVTDPARVTEASRPAEALRAAETSRVTEASQTAEASRAADRAIAGEVCFTTAAALAAVVGLAPGCTTPGGKWTPAESRRLCRTAADAGFGVEPDARVTARAYAPADRLALFPSAAPDVPDPAKYRAAACFLRIGLALAAADGVVKDAEVAAVVSHVESAFDLGEATLGRLAVLRALLLSGDPADIATGRPAKALTAALRQAAGRLTLALVAADGALRAENIEVLRACYLRLGFDKSDVEDVLRPFSVAARPAPEELNLNRDAIASIMRQTQEVSRLLAEAMAVPEEDPETARPTEAATPATAEPPALPMTGSPPARYAEFYEAVIARERWPLAEADALARRQGHMLAGAVEALNEWSAETNGGPLLIEDDQTLVVEINLLTKPREEQEPQMHTDSHR